MHSELNFVKNSARGNAMYNNRGKNNRIIFEISTLYFFNVEIQQKMEQCLHLLH